MKNETSKRRDSVKKETGDANNEMNKGKWSLDGGGMWNEDKRQRQKSRVA